MTEPQTPPEIKYMSAAEYGLMTYQAQARHGRQGRLNGYVCATCKHIRITIDRDSGVTPENIRCDRCPAVKTIGKMKFPQAPRFMQTVFYKLPAEVTEAMAYYEFYRPSYEFYLSIQHIFTKRHLEKGGLLMRVIGEIYPIGYEGMMTRKV